MANDHGLKYWLNTWIPVAIGAGIIALESTEFMGSDHTNGPLRFLFQAIFGPVSSSEWEALHGLLRKSGHFVGYGFIGLAWLRALWLTLPQSRFFHDAILALLGTALLAAADEYHQIFLPNRTGSARDLLLDCCGAAALQLATYAFLTLFKPNKLARAV